MDDDPELLTRLVNEALDSTDVADDESVQSAIEAGRRRLAEEGEER